jgi:hydroxylamine reductase
MDLLIYVLKGVSVVVKAGGFKPESVQKAGDYITRSLFATITNANFDSGRISALIAEGVDLKASIAAKDGVDSTTLHAAAGWRGAQSDYAAAAALVGVLSEENADKRSLQQLLVYGLKGISAYAHHAQVLGFEDAAIYRFICEALDSTLQNLSTDEMVAMVLKAGEFAVTTMALLDKANTSTYGNPEITSVNIGTGNSPGILVSGHDLLDLKELLEQTKGSGVDVYSHSEMLPAHYYPELKKYSHFVGNYGGAWWQQDKEFASFNGPILMTTNCIVPVKDSYKDRIFTTGMTGYPGVVHIPDRIPGGTKDFSALIALAKKCEAPTQIETGTITGGFAHAQVFALADKVVAAVQSGAIKRFIVMGGCDGRHKERDYFTKVAQQLPSDTIILTAGCAKYRYNKLQLGDIGGIPRVLDAGQCNDSYSLALIALKLKEVFGLDDVNKLPLSFDIAWYEQKAVAVLLALLYLGFKKIRLGPTLPGFLSPGVAEVLVSAFGIMKTDDPASDVEKMMASN